MAKHSSVYRSTLLYFLIVVLVFLLGVLALLVFPTQDHHEKQLVLELVKEAETPERRAEIARLEAAVRQQRRGATEAEYRDARAKLNQIVESSPVKEKVRTIIQHQLWRFIITLSVVVGAILLVMLVILRLILVPLDILIAEGHRVALGNLQTDFRKMSGSHAEIAGLADVMQNLTTNFGEILHVMNNAVTQGRANLEQIKSGGGASEAGIRDFEYLLQSMSDMVEYFKSQRAKE